MFVLLTVIAAATLTAQEKQDRQIVQDDEVLRVNTELVQTDVMVFDKQGHFAEGLKPEQFQLKVDGKVLSIEFFDRVVAGSVNEEAQLAAARGVKGEEAGRGGRQPVSILPRGRTTIFYVDDLHLAFDSLRRSRTSIERYIDSELGQNDQALISSASGRIGFLQQLTNEKPVLKAALARLSYKQYAAEDHMRPRMSEYNALNISRNDRDTTGYFVDEYIKDNPGVTRESAENAVEQRARAILLYAASVTRTSLSTLLDTVKNLSEVHGRKLLVVLSDGFFMDPNNSDSFGMLNRITDQSRKSNVVIYTVDARGLITGMPDAGSDYNVDLTHRLDRSAMGEITASQDGLNALAVDTGGKAMRNSNDITAQVGRSVRETANYYLLAWRPQNQEQKSTKFRKLEVTIAGRPDLTVRVRKGLFLSDPDTKRPERKGKSSITAEATPDSILKDSIVSMMPDTKLQMALTVNYLEASNKGPMLSASMEIAPNELSFSAGTDGKQRAQVEFLGLVFDDHGKQVGHLRDLLTVSAGVTQNAATTFHGPAYAFSSPVKPGLYQVRVAVLDINSKRTGSARQWIEVPDIATGHFAMSSILIGERKLDSAAQIKAKPQADSPVQDMQDVVLTKRFGPASYLRFVTVIYNPKRGVSEQAEKPDVVLQVQIFRDNQPVITTALRKISTEGIQDMSKLPYAAETSLAGLPVGRYDLRITAIDRTAKQSVSQHANFIIEQN